MRENTAYLYGQLTRDPICYKNPSTQELLSGQITIKTARRTNATGELFVKGRLRIDFITIYSRNEKLIREQFMSLRQGDIVLVKGSLSTQETEKKFICKKCGHEMIKHEAVVIYIDPLHIKKFASGLSTEEGLKEIENNIEISNEINGINFLIYMLTSNFWLFLLILGMVGTIILQLKAEIDTAVREEQNII